MPESPDRPIPSVGPPARPAVPLPRRTRRILYPLVWLVLGLALGWLLAGIVPRYHVPTEAELGRLCALPRGTAARPWQYLILHHSAGDAGNAAVFDRMHRAERGWDRGLGYQFVIGNGQGSGDGEIEVGPRWARQIDGAHCKADDMNTKAIGICFVGNFENGRGPTQAQIHSGLALVRFLARRFGIPPERILGHREVPGAETLCPGRSFPVRLLREAGTAS